MGLDSQERCVRSLMIPALGEPPRGGTPIRSFSKPTNAPRGGGRLKQKKSFYFKPWVLHCWESKHLPKKTFSHPANTPLLVEIFLGSVHTARGYLTKNPPGRLFLYLLG